MKNQKSIGVYLTLAGAIIAVIALVLYRSVMYKYQPVNYMLIGAIVLSVVAFLIAGAVPSIAGLVPVSCAALMMSAAVWGASLMVNQIGYVVAGLDGIDTIMGFIIFATVSAVGMLMYIIAAFLPQAKAAE